jgi:DNA segregation ATPase FtsK/SpoIIIE-like protein
LKATRTQQLHEEGAAYYQAARPDRLPAVVVVIDRYARLIGDPAVAAAIGTMARTGRSLGIHLVLTSQRDNNGNNEIEDNVRYRLRLSDRAIQLRSMRGHGDRLFTLPGDETSTL